MEFLATMYGRENPMSQMCLYLVKVEDLVEDMRLHLRGKFDNLRKFLGSIKVANPDQISSDDLCE